LAALVAVATALSAGTLLTPVVAAAATSPTVHVDPKSPVAKQYQIPLATARGAPPGSSTPTRLFGSGITHVSSPPPSSAPAATNPTAPAAQATTTQAPTTRAPAAHTRAGSTAPAHHAHHRRAAVAAATGGTAAANTAPETASPPPALKVLHSGSEAGLAWMVGLAALVLALGAASALVLTARSRRSSPRAG
jgi:hypothetical protein